MVKASDPDRIENLILELRRGAIVLAILGQLRDRHYGYSLRERLADGGLEVNEGTLYPLLRRLEAQELLQSEWQLGEGRPRRYYWLSPAGHAALATMQREWEALIVALRTLTSET